MAERDSHDEEPIPAPTPLPSDEEIQRRMQDALDRARRLSGHAPEATVPADVTSDDEEADRAAARLERIEAQIDSGTQTQFPDAPEMNFTRPRVPGGADHAKGAGYKGVGVGLSMAYSMIGMTLLGWGIGKLFDLHSGGVLGQAIGTILGATMGLFGAVYTAIRTQK